jgi:membrane peptidoglycan carboxypeptidase
MRNWSIFVLAMIAIFGVCVALVFEGRTSWLQARELSRYSAELNHRVQPGPSDAIRLPDHGPFDARLGYTGLRRFSERLVARDFVVERQARFSPDLLNYADHGYFVPYREKTRAGIEIHGLQGQLLFRYSYPLRGYESFAQIPPVVVQSLLFIENRSLLDAEAPNLNPAVDWGRFGRAVMIQLARVVDSDLDAPGGSTLATQIEKYRHSPGGITHSPREKLRQMVSASVRAYRAGPETIAMRHQLVLDYLNTVPLSAAQVYGEVHGLGDGLWVWYGADFERTNTLLAAPEGEGEHLAEQGQALRRVLSLMIAHRRPSYYLGGGRNELAQLTDSHLRVLAEAGIIGPGLRDAALKSLPEFRDLSTTPARVPAGADKGSTVIRSQLAELLGVSLYELDRLDLNVSATLDNSLQQTVSDYLARLADPDFAREAGIIGERLLSPQRVGDVHYSFTLFEQTSKGNRVRVQTDTTDQPLDINEGSKLELGSTAKLRVLATYLELVAELHKRLSTLPDETLRATPVDRQDVLTRWALDYLIRARDRNLPAMLEAALERRYSASPAESFFTGGGLHTFNNFRPEDNERSVTVREALQASINLPFVRLMREIVRHTMYQVPGSTAKLLEDESDPRREEYLAKFADREGQVFLRRFWRKYEGLASEEMQASLLRGLRPTVDRLAATYRYLKPDADKAAFAAFIADRLPGVRIGEAQLDALYRRYAPGAFDLPDQGYIARVHPLELWLVGFLSAHPGASYAQAVEASRGERQAVYRWLFRTRAKSARDQRIYTILEVEAFLEIHRRWVRFGYPFPHLVPSLATALGSSGDRPAALAELMGVIVNEGVRQPTIRIDGLHFAANTPFETVFGRRKAAAEQVMAREVAAALRNALSEVVEGGTARSLAGAFSVTVGGKTGTGDNRIVTAGVRGTALNRTATFVFYLGPRYFGTITAYVVGRDAEAFGFTSGLPVRILKSMEPILAPYLAAEPDAGVLPADLANDRIGLGPSAAGHPAAAHVTELERIRRAIRPLDQGRMPREDDHAQHQRQRIAPSADAVVRRAPRTLPSDGVMPAGRTGRAALPA